ncbi:hypothetical protein [Stenotrophomonas sp. 278]|uniref:hypothetical protein n=1 Tax=Stenotrophomonas sp. 278 TaxID=2479851 RepID=UPI000F66D2AC|nr:hypothetical protein [Stenotrophomonas sp. 278]
MSTNAADCRSMTNIVGANFARQRAAATSDSTEEYRTRDAPTNNANTLSSSLDVTHAMKTAMAASSATMRVHREKTARFLARVFDMAGI